MYIISSNIFWHNSKVDTSERQNKYGHKAVCIWLTGLSGSGKSTIAVELERYLFDLENKVFILDGDNIRHGLNNDLGFSREERRENIRRVGEVAKLFVDAGFIVITAFISPYKEDRERVRGIFKSGSFIEVFVDSNIEVCEKRDHKKLYTKARNAEINNFTGVNDEYEFPENPELILKNNEKNALPKNVERILKYLRDHDIFKISLMKT